VIGVLIIRKCYLCPCENSHIFAHLRICDAAYFAYLALFAAYFSALFRQIPYIFLHILHQNGPHILRKIFALWSCVWCIFTAGAKSDDPLSHPHYGATQNGLPKIRIVVQVLYRPTYIWADHATVTCVAIGDIVFSNAV